MIQAGGRAGLVCEQNPLKYLTGEKNNDWTIRMEGEWRQGREIAS
jgi:hypothetical protein